MTRLYTIAGWHIAIAPGPRIRLYHGKFLFDGVECRRLDLFGHRFVLTRHTDGCCR